LRNNCFNKLVDTIYYVSYITLQLKLKILIDCIFLLKEFGFEN